MTAASELFHITLKVCVKAMFLAGEGGGGRESHIVEVLRVITPFSDDVRKCPREPVPNKIVIVFV